jgi:hypothetical protein
MKPRLKTPAEITARQSQCTRCVISQKSKHIQHRGERCRGPVAEPEPEAQAKAPPDHPKPSLSTTDSVPSRTHKLQRPPSQRSLSAACIAGTKLRPFVVRSDSRRLDHPSSAPQLGELVFSAQTHPDPMVVNCRASSKHFVRSCSPLRLWTGRITSRTLCVRALYNAH